MVLTGGSCVSVWTHNAYASLDLDFIALGLSDRQIGEALRILASIRRWPLQGISRCSGTTCNAGIVMKVWPISLPHAGVPALRAC